MGPLCELIKIFDDLHLTNRAGVFYVHETDYLVEASLSVFKSADVFVLFEVDVKIGDLSVTVRFLKFYNFVTRVKLE